MNDVMDTVDGWVDDGSRVALATVVDTKKSAPQPPGTKMAINDAGKLMGAVSGFFAVALGAFGEHALWERLSTDRLAIFETAGSATAPAARRRN